MPRSLDPNAVLKMVLACDVDKTPQPRIFAKHPTLNQQRKLIALLSNIDQSNMLEALDSIVDATVMLITGWENIPIEFSRDTIGDVLSLDEMVEVLNFLVASTRATPEDKKKSESPPLCGAENSANPA